MSVWSRQVRLLAVLYICMEVCRQTAHGRSRAFSSRCRQGEPQPFSIVSGTSRLLSTQVTMFFHSRLRRRPSLEAVVGYLEDEVNGLGFQGGCGDSSCASLANAPPEVDHNDDYDILIRLPSDRGGQDDWIRILMLTPSMAETCDQVEFTMTRIHMFIYSAKTCSYVALFYVPPHNPLEGEELHCVSPHWSPAGEPDCFEHHVIRSHTSNDHLARHLRILTFSDGADLASRIQTMISDMRTGQWQKDLQLAYEKQLPIVKPKEKEIPASGELLINDKAACVPHSSRLSRPTSPPARMSIPPHFFQNPNGHFGRTSAHQGYVEKAAPVWPCGLQISGGDRLANRASVSVNQPRGWNDWSLLQPTSQPGRTPVSRQRIDYPRSQSTFAAVKTAPLQHWSQPQLFEVQRYPGSLRSQSSMTTLNPAGAYSQTDVESISTYPTRKVVDQRPPTGRPTVASPTWREQHDGEIDQTADCAHIPSPVKAPNSGDSMERMPAKVQPFRRDGTLSLSNRMHELRSEGQTPAQFRDGARSRFYARSETDEQRQSRLFLSPRSKHGSSQKNTPSPPKSSLTTSSPLRRSSPCAGMDLLPFCTTEGTLSRSETVGLSDVAGSLREVVLLASSGQPNETSKDVLNGALGGHTASCIRDFWTGEWTADV